MLSWRLLKLLSAKSGECARLKNRVADLEDDNMDLLLRYNRLMGQYSGLLRECIPADRTLGDRV
ncbi:MAG: hypothetical protein A3E01_06565 [Gammaproteobacteria bacterium RIFCSPHIGHO2_12_FULL_63_22]|nr:MAG: hypothetical protein A3E01_06565 [Gammaproteobacteria bacterium RIFCSPHIGHO2_12_FULL_63_22]